MKKRFKTALVAIGTLIMFSCLSRLFMDYLANCLCVKDVSFLGLMVFMVGGSLFMLGSHSHPSFS